MEFETRLAKASWAPVDLRDIDKVYNPFDVVGATKATPGVDWARWLDAMTIRGHDHLIVGQPSYFKELGKALGDVPLATWQDYLALRAIDTFSPYLSQAFVDENFDFYGRTLSGTPQLKPRWKRGLDETESSMGDLLGKEYVERHFPPEAKQRMDALVANLLKAFAVSIDELDWMSPETKQQAHDKINNFTVKIGYPEKWKTYPGLVVHRDDLVGNVQRAREVNTRRELAKLGQPVDKTEWYMTPQTVNAYYNPLANEIVFPAAILQPPFFDMKADDAVNYGGIGAVIGHEISHGFDDQGRKFDGKGVLRDWWTTRGQRTLHVACQQPREAVRRLQPAARHERQRPAHARREHRRPLRARGCVQGVPALARRQAGPGARRLHRRPALLPRLGPDLGAQVPRGRIAQAPQDGSAQPERVPLERHPAQHARRSRRRST